MTGRLPAVHVLIGPPRHGVVRHGHLVARAGCGELRISQQPPDPRTVAGRRVIVHFTDRLFGTDALVAATALVQLIAPAGRSVVVLHDLPQASDGSAWQRRRAGYARVAGAADVVVVSSGHEAGLLADLAPGVRPVVIPLPIDHSPYAVPSPAEHPSCWEPGRPAVGVLGYLYPGKGLEQVIDAVAGLPVQVVNLGTVAAGHGELLPVLQDRARDRDVAFTVTGWLDDAAMAGAIAAVDVPVAPHQHISASGSINAWLAAGRRPIVLDSPYVRELTGRLPGALQVVAGPDRLTAAVQDALAQPDRTRLGEIAIGPSSAQAAARLEALA